MNGRNRHRRIINAMTSTIVYIIPNAATAWLNASGPGEKRTWTLRGTRRGLGEKRTQTTGLRQHWGEKRTLVMRPGSWSRGSLVDLVQRGSLASRYAESALKER